MNVLAREKQIEVIAALCEGVGIRTASRLTTHHHCTLYGCRVGYLEPAGRIRIEGKICQR